MSADLRRLTTDLHDAVEQLKGRCLEREARIADLQSLVAQQQTRIVSLESEVAEIKTRYQNLKSGLAAAGHDPEAVRQLRQQYHDLISQLDFCIAKLKR